MNSTEIQHRIPVDQGLIAAREFTGGSGTPLVVLHGGPGVPSEYLESLSALSSERTVVLYDQIGCGESSDPSADFVWDVPPFIDHLEAVRTHFGFRAFHLYGHSWGGFLALAYTELHPTRVRTVTLGSPLVDARRWSEDCAELISELPDVDRRAIGEGPGSSGYEAAEAEFYRRHFCRLDPFPPELANAMSHQDARSYQAMWGPNEFTPTGVLRDRSLAEAAARMSMPNLWLAGSDDEARPSTLAEFAASNPHGNLVVFPDATHCAHLEAPEDYRAAMRIFLWQHD